MTNLADEPLLRGGEIPLWGLGGGGWGVGLLNKVLYGEAPSRGPNPYY